MSRLSTNLLVLWLVKGRSCSSSLFQPHPSFASIFRGVSDNHTTPLSTLNRDFDAIPPSSSSNRYSLPPLLPGSEADRLIFPIYIYLLSAPSSRRGPFQIPPTSRHYTTIHYRYLHLPYTSHPPSLPPPVFVARPWHRQNLSPIQSLHLITRHSLHALGQLRSTPEKT